MIAVADPVAPTAADQNQPRTIVELIQTVSASRLSTWQRCRLQFYFRYVAGIQKAPTPARHIGTSVHTVLQHWNLDRWHGRELNVQTLKETFSQAWTIWQEGEQIDWEGKEEASKSATWNLIQVYLRDTPIAPDEKPEAVEVGVEADLSVYGLPTLVGVIDLVRSGGRIVDYKTMGQTPKDEKAIHNNEVQLSIYSLLYRESTDRKENGRELHQLIKLKVPKLIVTSQGPMTDSEQTRLFKQLESYVAGVERQDFVPSPGMQCVMCSYFNECRKWS